MCKQAARYDDIDDLVSIASTGVSLNSKDSEGRTGCYSHMLKLLSYVLSFINVFIISGTA